MTSVTQRSPSDGAIRLVAFVGDGVREWADGEALAELERGGAAPAAALATPATGGARTSEDRPSVWIDLTEPAPRLVERVAAALGLHPLIAEDILEGNQRSKIEATDGLVHLVLFALEYGDEVDAHEVDLVLGDGFLLSVHPRAWDARGGQHLRSGLEPILRAGPDHLLWALVDDIVDRYFPFTDRLADAIDDLQDLVIARPDRATLARLFQLKRELISVRRAVSPVREILNQLTNRELDLIDADETIYFRDIYDHTIRLTDELDTDRELVQGTLDAYLSTVNNNLSLIMKRLTGVTVILAGIGAIAGVFGMSEAGPAFGSAEAAGFWIVAAGVVVFALVIAFVLHRIDWI